MANLPKSIILLGILLIHIQSLAQKPIYKNLVLEGGGIRGIAYGGALSVLDQRGILANIKRVGGTSAGAIQAALLAVGYTPQEITDITFQTPIQKLSDGRFFFFGGFNRLNKQFGWYRGEKFRKLLEELIKNKTGNPNLTFAQLHNFAGSNNFRELYVMGTNLTTQRAVVLSYETYPNMKVSDAVRISMSVPLFFRAVFVDKQGQVVKKSKNSTGFDVMVDGGILANFPIDLFDNIRFTSTTLKSATGTSDTIFNKETIGIRLDTDAQIKYDLEQAGLAPLEIQKFKDYIRAFYAIIIEQLNRQKLKPQDWNRTISVSTKGYGEKIRRLTEKDKQILLESGRAGVQSFFERNNQK